MKKSAVWLIPLCVSFFMSGCSILPQPPAAPIQYDFGPPLELHPALRLSHVRLQLGEVTAPDWLSGTDIHYRLLYNNPNQLRSYADSRWTAPAAELLRGRLLTALDAAAPSVPIAANEPSYTLYIHVAVFEQDFTAADSATAIMQIDALLRDTRDRRILSERQFTEKNASAPNARGASAALATAADKITAGLVNWLDSMPPPTNAKNPTP